MTRIHIVCEGQTEETFTKELLYLPFIQNGIHLIPYLLGGHVNIDTISLYARNILRKDENAYCTTFIDFYGLSSKFPGKTEATGKIVNKSKIVCDAMLSKITSDHGAQLARRFIPYVQMHEFEALLFSDPDKFAKSIGDPSKAKQFHSICSDFDTPEEINDNPISAPSKRIQALVKGYDKPLYGSLAAIEIGLTTLRSKCLLFDAWLKKLEALKT